MRLTKKKWGRANDLTGLENAVHEVFGAKVKVQLCILHKERNVMKYVSRGARPEIGEWLRKSLRTTNIIERTFKEVKRRIRPMETLPSEGSVNRFVYYGFRDRNSYSEIFQFIPENPNDAIKEGLSLGKIMTRSPYSF